jgi:AcrR family transcriptional regulator
MSASPGKREIYQNHRDSQHERILEAAEKLFIQAGIDRISMSAIARAARISRRTMYQYFSDKREIAWAIFQKLIDQWRTFGTLPPEASGLAQLEQFMTWMVNQLETSREHLRFIVELDALYARESSADRMRQITGRAGAGGDAGNGVDWIAQTVRKGIADGSIRADVDPEMVSAALLNLLSGMNARFALLGDLITQEYGQDALAIYKEICRSFLRGLQSQP